MAFRDVLQPPKGPGLDYEKVNKARKRRADSFLRGVGMSREQIRAIGGEFGERLKDIMPSEKAERGYCLPKHLGTWKRLSPYHEVSLPWGDIAQVDGSDDPHRWFLYRPPFWGFNFAFDSQATSNFTVSREHILSPPAGLVGHDLRVHANDTNDFDAAHAIADTQVAIGFVPPITGRIAVLIDAVSGEGQHYFSIKENEWGWSTAWTNQMNYLTMHVLHPNVPEPSLALMSSFSHENDEVETIEREYLIPNEHYFAHLVSAGQVPGEQSVVIVVGTRTFHIARADDIRLRTASKFIWYIRSIEVRVVP